MRRRRRRGWRVGKCARTRIHTRREGEFVLRAFSSPCPYIVVTYCRTAGLHRFSCEKRYTHTHGARGISSVAARTWFLAITWRRRVSTNQRAWGGGATRARKLRSPVTMSSTTVHSLAAVTAATYNATSYKDVRRTLSVRSQCVKKKNDKKKRKIHGTIAARKVCGNSQKTTPQFIIKINT